MDTQPKIILFGKWNEPTAQPKPKELMIVVEFFKGTEIDRICCEYGVSVSKVCELVRAECVIQQALIHTVRLELQRLRMSLANTAEETRVKIPLINDDETLQASGRKEGEVYGFLESAQKIADLQTQLELIIERAKTCD